jgi:hypothetical protein
LETTGQKSTNPSRKGDVCEAIVIAEALKRGAEVYKNVAATGPADLIIIHNGIIVQVDVKMMRKVPGTDYYGSYADKPLDNIYHALVHPETYEVRWMKRKKPPGLENFWEKNDN